MNLNIIDTKEKPSQTNVPWGTFFNTWAVLSRVQKCVPQLWTRHRHSKRSFAIPPANPMFSEADLGWGMQGAERVVLLKHWCQVGWALTMYTFMNQKWNFVIVSKFNRQPMEIFKNGGYMAGFPLSPYNSWSCVLPWDFY